jgi:phytanoyl-CoA hydroxylase
MANLPCDAKELQIAFDSDGFIVLRNFLDPGELVDLEREVSRYVTETVPQVPETDVYYEDKGNPATLKYMSRMGDHDAYFGDLISRKRWTSLAETLLGDAVVAKGVEWFNKPSRVGKVTPPHQDGYYFMLDPNEAVTMWLALDPVDETNGCVRYLPGSHRKGIRPHGRTELLGFSQGIVDYDSADRGAEIPMIASPGDLLVHHAMTIHRADGNPSPRHRRALGLVFYAARAQPDAPALAAYTRTLNAELKNKGAI